MWILNHWPCSKLTLVFLAHTNHLTSFSSLLGETEPGCKSHRGSPHQTPPSSSRCSLSPLQGSGPAGLALSQALQSHFHATVQTQPWGPNFTFLKLHKLVSTKKEPEAATSCSFLLSSSWKQEAARGRKHHMVSQERGNHPCYPERGEVEDVSKRKNIHWIASKLHWGSNLLLYTDLTQLKSTNILPLTKLAE